MTEEATKSREETKQETRTALMQAGLSLFMEEGVDGPSLDAICARAGYTRGAFYVHFKDRNEFVFACISRLMDDFVDGIIANSDTAGDLRQTINSFLDVANMRALPLTTAAPDGGLLQFVATSLHRNPEIRERYRELLERAMQGVANAAARGQDGQTVRTDVTPRQAATILVAAAIGLGAMLDAGVEVDVEGVRDAAHTLVWPRTS